MKKLRHTTEQIIEKLRQADVALGKGQKVPEICNALQITEQTYYRWRQKYGGMAPEMTRQGTCTPNRCTMPSALDFGYASANFSVPAAQRSLYPRSSHSEWYIDRGKAMVANGDRILALDERGELLLIRANPERFELLDSTKISETPTWAHLAVCGDELFVRELDGVTSYLWRESP